MKKTNKYLHSYIEYNNAKHNELFNEKFLLSRQDQDILKHARDIIKSSLELLPEIHVNEEEITLETDESMFGPIMQQDRYYKSVLPSRLNKLHFVVHVDGLPKPIEQDLFINKMIDNCFYINEGCRYYLIWQIVDAAVYGFGRGCSFRTMFMPVTLLSPMKFDVVPEFGKPVVRNLNLFEIALFSAKVAPFLYVAADWAMKTLRNNNMETIKNLDDYYAFRDKSIIDHIRNYYDVDAKFSDKIGDLVEDGRTVFAIRTDKEEGIYFSLPDEQVETKEGRVFISDLSFIKIQEKKSTKKKKLIFTMDDLYNPSYWINQLAPMFSSAADPYKKYQKVKDIFFSFYKLINEPVRKATPLADEHKTDTFAVYKYMTRNYNELSKMNGQNLDNKRVRLYEYMLYPLCVYLQQKIGQIQNATSKSLDDIKKIFTGLKPMFIVKQCVTSELLRYFNVTNEFNLFGALARYTYCGPQGYNASVSIEQRSIDPSYTGRLSLIASNASSPGTSGTFTPFVKIYDGYFVPQNTNKGE